MTSKLWSNCFDETVWLCVFDLLEVNGEDYRARPLVERTKRLTRLLVRPRDGIEYVEHLQGDGRRIFEHACRLGLEGIVSKRVDMAYRPMNEKDYQEAADTLARLLHGQTIFIDTVKLVDSGSAVNAQSLWGA
jgi:hypothetical protein